MCGIFLSQGIDITDSQIKLKLERIRMRGPDSSISLTLANSLVLCASRLAMVDKNLDSNQPFGAKHQWILFNGELYNHLSLRKLFLRGIHFRTESDTETLFELCRSGQMQTVRSFEGMYAFAYVDLNRKYIHLERDINGKKPLYYVDGDNSFQCGSLQSLFASGSKGEIDKISIVQFLNMGFIQDPFTSFTKLRALEAGENLTVSLGKNGARTHNSHTILGEEKSIKESSFKFLHSNPMHLREIIINCVKKRIVNQENVGISLSGGVDSAIIGIILRELGVRARAYTVFWPDSDKPRYNFDFNRAQVIANKLEHEFIPISGPRVDEIESLLDQYINIMEEPNSNPTGLSMIKLYEGARAQGTRLMLTGDGADEIFLGYERYRVLGNTNFLLRYFKKWSAHQSSGIKLLKPGSHQFEQWAYWHQIFPKAELNSKLGISIKLITQAETRNWSLIPDASIKDFKTRPIWLAKFDKSIWLNMESNRRLDRISMSFSVEARCPYQDVELLDYQNQLLSTIKPSKILSKKQLYAAFPELNEYVAKGEKMGFVSPLGHWIRNNTDSILREIVELENRLPFISPDITLVNSWAKSNDFKSLQKVWSLYVLSKWAKHELKNG